MTYDEDAPEFEKTPNSKYGNGDPRAANKGKVKRRLKDARLSYGARRKRRK